MTLKRLLKSIDYTLVLACLATIIFSLLVIGSATLEFTPESYTLIKDLSVPLRILHLENEFVVRQLFWLTAGILLMLFVVYIPYGELIKYTRSLYLLNIIMLGAVIFVGRESLGAQRWIDIGPFGFQPSEFAKVIVIVTLAAFLIKREGRLNSFREIIPCFIYAGIPILLILKQPDLGTSLVLIAITFGMLFVAGARPSVLMGFMGAGVLLVVVLFTTHSVIHNKDMEIEKQLLTIEEQAAAFQRQSNYGYESEQQQVLEKKHDQVLNRYKTAKERHEKFHRYTLKEYQMTRLVIFLNPESDPLGAGYHVWQSLIAVGSGGPFGKGLLGGTQSHLTFLPIRHTDFIFSVVGEEFGFIGAIVLLGLFFIIIYRGIQITLHARDDLGAFIAAGIVTMFAFHVMVNIGMTIGIMPVTGIPLPLFSYGGSNMIMNLIALGLLLNIYSRRKKIIF